MKPAELLARSRDERQPQLTLPARDRPLAYALLVKEEMMGRNVDQMGIRGVLIADATGIEHLTTSGPQREGIFAIIWPSKILMFGFIDAAGGRRRQTARRDKRAARYCRRQRIL
jgi:hypothetical protein